MEINRSPGEKAFDMFNNVLMCIVIGIMIFPMIHVISVSLSSGAETLKGGVFLYPRELSFKAYATVLKDPTIVTSYINTILYAVTHTILVLFLTALTSYPLAMPGFRLKKFVTIFLTITMFIGGGMIPTYLLMKSLHLINTRWVMIIPFCVGAYNVILFRTFFQGIPLELRESALMDGANEFRILFSLYFPLSKPIFATIGLFTIVGKWNEWFSALIYLNEESKYPLQMILRKILFSAVSLESMDPASAAMVRNMEVTGQNIKMAAIIVTILPILCIYPFIQKHFVKGVFVGTIKG